MISDDAAFQQSDAVDVPPGYWRENLSRCVFDEPMAHVCIYASLPHDRMHRSRSLVAVNLWVDVYWYRYGCIALGRENGDQYSEMDQNH